MAENIECPNCRHTWPGTAIDLGLGKCPACNADIVVSRRPAAWIYEVEVVGVVKAEDDT